MGVGWQTRSEIFTDTSSKEILHSLWKSGLWRLPELWEAKFPVDAANVSTECDRYFSEGLGLIIEKLVFRFEAIDWQNWTDALCFTRQPPLFTPPLVERRGCLGSLVGPGRRTLCRNNEPRRLSIPIPLSLSLEMQARRNSTEKGPLALYPKLCCIRKLAVNSNNSIDKRSNGCFANQLTQRCPFFKNPNWQFEWIRLRSSSNHSNYHWWPWWDG